MRIPLLLIVMSVCLGITGCASKLATYDYNSDFNFGSYTKYAIHEQDSADYQSIDSGRIKAAIESNLAGRYQKVAPAEADFLVDYRIVKEQAIKESGVSFGFGFGVSRNVGVGVSTGPKTTQVTEGRLVLQVVDQVSQQMVWTAKAQRNLEPSMKPQQRSDLIQDVVKAMLGNFPP